VRGVWIGYQRMAVIAEQRGQPEAADWWQRALDQAPRMQRDGTLAERYQALIDHARRALARVKGKDQG